MGKKRNKKAIIITALVMLAGILLVLAGIFGGSIAGLFFKGFDPKNITPDVVGKNIRTDIMVDYDDLDLENKAVQNFGDREEVYMITLDLSALSESDRRLYYSKITQHITIDGTLRPMGDDEYNEVAESMFRHYDYIYYNKVEEVPGQAGLWKNSTIC